MTVLWYNNFLNVDHSFTKYFVLAFGCPQNNDLPAIPIQGPVKKHLGKCPVPRHYHVLLPLPVVITHKRNFFSSSAEVQSVKVRLLRTSNYLPLHKCLRLRSAKLLGFNPSYRFLGANPYQNTRFLAAQRQVLSPTPYLHWPTHCSSSWLPNRTISVLQHSCFVPFLLKHQGPAPCSRRLVTPPLSFVTLYQPFPH